MYNEWLKIIGKVPYQHRLALWTLENYVNGAIIQWNRIQADKKTLPGPPPGVDQTLVLILFLDIHFYFICGDKVQNLLEYLAKANIDPKLKDLWNRYKPRLEPFNRARNHLEHIETRTSPEYERDFGNLKGDIYTFGGERFDISASSLKILTDAYEEVVNILHMRDDLTSSAAG